ncbi:MAG: FtsW/RodA/SpoVE family cell cycle protein, partial [Clostridiales bacterium]|nr:FtsW/RodA/SpoVE family cell cycle protein [Clostridiales bacterium]
GNWVIYDLGAAAAASVNDVVIPKEGTSLCDGDVISVSDSELHFYNLTEQEREVISNRRTAPGKLISPAGMFAYVTLIQIILFFQNLCYADAEHRSSVGLAFSALIIVTWLYFIIMRAIGRKGFEIEALAFFLSSVGMAVASSSTPENMLKQTLLLLAGVSVFIFFGWWLRDLERVKKMRLPAAAIALLLLAFNVILGTEFFGAKNWISIGGFTFQPSEFVKIAFIYAGAETMDRLYRNRNLLMFIGFSAVCVGALALIGDFGTALIFFSTFLVLSFMRSGNIGTVLLAVTGAGLAGFLALSIKPHIAQRFAAWGHVWEDVNNSGYQQTRAMSAAASGGLFGRGSGNGWLQSIVAADTDLVFEVVCEELGLIVGLCIIAAIILMALFVIRNAAKARSSFYVIAGTAAVSMMMIQMALNVFGSLDILPFTGVTFPFVSLGGSSLISCWALLAYIKATDTRKNASFVVRSPDKLRDRNEFTRWSEDDEDCLDIESPFVDDSREEYTQNGRNIIDGRGVRRRRRR